MHIRKFGLDAQRSYPAPPPPETPTPPAQTPSRSEFHLPGTNIFRSFRAQLSALESPTQFKSQVEPFTAFIMALVFGAFFGVAVALGIEQAIVAAIGQSQSANNAFFIIVAPLVEEIIKALCILGVALTLPRAFPNRRYGAAWGAATGLGFGTLSATLSIMTAKVEGGAALVRVIVTPFSNPLWSAFVGISVFAFIAIWQRRNSFSDTLSLLTFVFFFFGLFNHIVWNAVSILIPNPVASGIVNLIAVFPPFAFLLRDLLGGHFNFNRFFEPLQETPLPPP